MGNDWRAGVEVGRPVRRLWLGSGKTEDRGRQMSMQLLVGLISVAMMEGGRANVMPKTVSDGAGNGGLAASY